MAFTTTDVVSKAILLGDLNAEDQVLIERLTVTAEMILVKTNIYLGYDCTTVDALLNILAEITVQQLNKYKTLSKETENPVKKITRGDYTVEYETDDSATYSDEVFDRYTTILKSFKKLRSL